LLGLSIAGKGAGAATESWRIEAGEKSRPFARSGHMAKNFKIIYWDAQPDFPLF